jgi:hypothetical protein
MSADDAKRTFKNLRARYSRENRKIKKMKRSGTSSKEVLNAVRETSDTFPYFYFLDNYISPRAIKSNLIALDHTSSREYDSDDETSFMDTSNASSALDTENENRPESVVSQEV